MRWHSLKSMPPAKRPSKARTANFLALALDNGGKPIVLTGAQKPYHAADSDAPANLRTAIAALPHALLGFLQDGDVLLAMGAGSISKTAQALVDLTAKTA